MLKFISFGSGSSGNCYYLFTERDGLLIDAGIGIRTLKKCFHDNGLLLSDVKHIIVTHDHADHVKSIGVLSGEYQLPVYATPEVHAGIERNYCVHRKITPNNAKHMTKGDTLTLGDFTVTSFGVPHDSADNVGYRIRACGTTFCIITDAGHITDEMKPYIAEAQYLVIEANHDVEMLLNGPYPEHLKRRVHSERGHLSNDECAQALVENATPALKHVWLCHLSEENNHPELARKTIEMTLRANGIIAGKDFQLDVLKRKTPSPVFLLE